MTTAWPFGDLKPLRYGALLLDPDWLFRLRSPAGEEKSAQAHYECSPIEELKALPVGHLAAPDCLAVMWATAPMMPQALELLAHYGFRFVTMGAWAKQSSTGTKLAFGTGYVLRSAAEFFLVGAIGAPRYRSKSVRNLILAPTRGHSRKPDAMYGMIEALVEGPYAELFARQEWPGWESCGDELGKFPAAVPA